MRGLEPGLFYHASACSFSVRKWVLFARSYTILEVLQISFIEIIYFVDAACTCIVKCWYKMSYWLLSTRTGYVAQYVSHLKEGSDYALGRGRHLLLEG